MNKPLEALYRLATRNNGNRRSDEEVDKDFKIVENALTEYESIDNANPSEALECLQSIEADLTGLPKHVTEYDDGFDNYLEDIWNNIDTIKQVIIKKSKKEQAWDKLVGNHLIWFEDKMLKLGRQFDCELCFDETDFDNKEEFNLLKEVLE